MSEQFPDHFSCDVGQTVIASFVAVCQSLMIDAQQMQQSGVQVMDMHGVPGNVVTEFVGFAMNQT